MDVFALLDDQWASHKPVTPKFQLSSSLYLKPVSPPCQPLPPPVHHSFSDGDTAPTLAEAAGEDENLREFLSAPNEALPSVPEHPSEPLRTQHEAVENAEVVDILRELGLEDSQVDSSDGKASEDVATETDNVATHRYSEGLGPAPLVASADVLPDLGLEDSQMDFSDGSVSEDLATETENATTQTYSKGLGPAPTLVTADVLPELDFEDSQVDFSDGKVSEDLATESGSVTTQSYSKGLGPAPPVVTAVILLLMPLWLPVLAMFFLPLAFTWAFIAGTSLVTTAVLNLLNRWSRYMGKLLHKFPIALQSEQPLAVSSQYESL